MVASPARMHLRLIWLGLYEERTCVSSLVGLIAGVVQLEGCGLLHAPILSSLTATVAFLRDCLRFC